MKSRNILGMCVVALFWSSCVVLAAEWQTLFDGNSLTGWQNPYAWGKSTVVDGEIHLVANKKFFLCSEKEYGDFIFEVEVKMPEGKSNSGFMFRAAKKHNKVWGYQAEVDTDVRAWSGGIYGESFGAWRFQPRKPVGSPAGCAYRTATKGSFKRHDWNKYRIHCEGSRLRVYVNDILCSDYFDDSRDKGYIALQHHGEKGKVYRFRNIRIKEIEKPECFGHDSKEVFNEHFDEGKMKQEWIPTDSGAWELTKANDSGVLSLKRQSKYKPPSRSPQSILWLTKDSPKSFVMDVLAKSTDKKGGAHQDLCLFFGGKDKNHFYYVHLAPKADPHAHSIFIVDGKPRLSIATKRTDGIKWGDDWHRLRIERDGESGRISVYFDDFKTPIMEAVNKHFIGGGIGVGSFDNTGYFDDIRVVEVK